MASKRRLRRKACGSKQQHATAVEANDAMHSLIRRLKKNGSPHAMLSIYKCPHGNHWHVGHPPKKVKQTIANHRKLRKRD